MPYQSVLDGFVDSTPGVLAALLLDSEGEVIVGSGMADERMRLIGAYQGIALATAKRSSQRYGDITYVLSRYAWGRIILRPLKDGYYFIVSLGGETLPAVALYRSRATQERFDQEL